MSDTENLRKWTALTKKYLDDSVQVLQEIGPVNFEIPKMIIQPFLQTLKICMVRVETIADKMDPPKQKTEDVPTPNNVVQLPKRQGRRYLEVD